MIKLNYQHTPTRKLFRELKIGDVIFQDHFTYIKTDNCSTTGSVIKNCVCLETGEFKWFSDSDLVCVPRVEMFVEWS